MRKSVSFKYRLMTSVFMLPVTGWLALGPALAFDVTGSTDDAAVTDTIVVSAPLDDDNNTISAAQNIIIGGTPTDNDTALRIDADIDVSIDGEIAIRDRSSTDDDATAYTLGNAVGIKVEAALTGTDNLSLRLESGARINIFEMLGPGYDADGDGFADNDEDEDRISEGSQALAGVNERIGLWVNQTIADALIGETGSRISVYGNGNNSDNIVAGVLIGAALGDNLDLSTAISMFGDGARGVDIDSTIAGYYRHRGEIDVRGEEGVGIDISGAIDGALMVEGMVNSTGYSTIFSGAPGGPLHGRDESDLTAEQAQYNADERRRSDAAINIANNVKNGVLIGGAVNRVSTQAERDSLGDITDARADDDTDPLTGTDVTAQKTDPYHYDVNRQSGSVTSYGEADDMATLKITGIVGLGDGTNMGSVETLLDTTNDDGLSSTDAYRDGLKQFYYSHGLINRGTIESSGLYDGFKADALWVANGATVHGGIYNNGLISAQALNEDAQALIIDGTLNDGLRADNRLFLNEGTVRAIVSTHTGADNTKTKSSDAATAIKLGAGATLTATGTPTFVNRGLVSASSTFITAATDDTAQSSILGTHATAFDFSAFTGNVNITQELLAVDGLRTPNSANAANNPFLGGGDMDIDLNGDGVIDTRDVSAPAIVGDVKFGSGNNVFAINAGTMAGTINFGSGDDSFTLSNPILDDADDDYTAPTVTFTGRMTNSGGNLNLDVGARTQVHLIGQEGDDSTELENLAINELDLSGDLKFTVDNAQLSANTPLLDVQSLTLNSGAKITPKIIGLIEGETTVRLIDYASKAGSAAPINDFLGDETPFVYGVTLLDESNQLSARFSPKDAAALGLTRTSEVNALPAVLAYFGEDENTLLSSAITGIESEADFHAAYRQVLPHYGDGTLKQLSSLAQSATGAVSQHLQIVNAGGRRDGDGWLQQFGDYRKQDSSAQVSTLSGTSYGIAFGFDVTAGFIDALGAYGQMSYTSVDEKTGIANEVKAESFVLGAYLADTIGPLRYELNAALGDVTFDSTRLINFAGAVDSLVGAWDGTSTAASVRLAYPLLDGRNVLRLEAGMDYFQLEQDAYDERSRYNGAGADLHMRVGAAESEVSSNYLGLRGGLRRGGGSPTEIVWEPNYYLGYRTVGDYTPYQATAGFVGAATRADFNLQAADDLDDVAELGIGVAAHNDYFAFEFNYRGQFGDDVEMHGGGVSIRLLF